MRRVQAHVASEAAAQLCDGGGRGASGHEAHAVQPGDGAVAREVPRRVARLVSNLEADPRELVRHLRRSGGLRADDEDRSRVVDRDPGPQKARLKVKPQVTHPRDVRSDDDERDPRVALPRRHRVPDLQRSHHRGVGPPLREGVRPLVRRGVPRRLGRRRGRGGNPGTPLDRAAVSIRSVSHLQPVRVNPRGQRVSL